MGGFEISLSYLESWLLRLKSWLLWLKSWLLRLKSCVLRLKSWLLHLEAGLLLEPHPSLRCAPPGRRRRPLCDILLEPNAMPLPQSPIEHNLSQHKLPC